MEPERVKIIGRNKIEEFYWAGKLVCYVNSLLVEKSFDEVCRFFSTAGENAVLIDSKQWVGYTGHKPIVGFNYPKQPYNND